jgi:hypothetical protein
MYTVYMHIIRRYYTDKKIIKFFLIYREGSVAKSYMTKRLLHIQYEVLVKVFKNLKYPFKRKKVFIERKKIERKKERKNRLNTLCCCLGNVLPGIWLVQGHTSCSGLTGEVAAFKLADITGPGSDRRRIPALSWDSFQGSCVMVLLDETKRRRAGATTETAAAAAVVAVTTAETLAVGNALSSSDANLSSDDAMTTAVTATPAAESAARGEREGRAAKRILRLVPTARFFLPINLAAFTVLSAGYSSKFTLTMYYSRISI